MDNDISARLKNIRTKMELSQRQLAKISGVANATISQIESATLNPTVSLLKKILDGIPISLSDFFADPFDFSEQIFYTAEELVEIGDGAISFRQVGSHLHNKAIQLLKESYQPGSHTGKHPLIHQGEECGIILTVSLEVTVDGQTKKLKAGDAYYFKSNQPHRFRNTGRDPCELITACTPPSF